MPIPITLTADEATRGLPRRLLRPLVAQQRREVIDPEDGSESTSWVTVQFLGRIGRGRATEADEQGRQGAVTDRTLYTGFDGLRTEDRILDPTDPEGQPWELAGDPITVWAADSLHHFEAPIRRVVG